MTQLQELVVPLKLDDSNFSSGIENSITKATAFGTVIGNLATSAISGAFNLLGKGLDAVNGLLTDSVKEAMDSQDAIAQLEAVIKSTGGVAGVTSKQAQDLASSYQKVTKYSDEAVLSGESMLLTFTSIGKDIFPRATETILDMSTALGQDLKSSAIQLGKALNDPISGITALRRVGVQFTDEQEKMIKKMVESGDLMKAQTYILDELQREFGGSAVAAGQTLGGQLEILKNKLSDIKENIGNALLPVLTELAGRFSKLIDSPAVQNAINTLVTKLGEFGNYVITNLPIWIQKFEEFTTNVKKFYDEKFIPAVADAKGELILFGIKVQMIQDLEKQGIQVNQDSAKSWSDIAAILAADVTGSLEGVNTLFTNLNSILGLLGIKTGEINAKTAVMSGLFQALMIATGPILSFWQNLNNNLNRVNTALGNIINNWRLFISVAKTAASIALPGLAPILKNKSTSGGGGGKTGRASGGAVIAGQSYNVAEFYKPEVFTPNKSGRIDGKQESKVVVDIDYNKLASVLAVQLAKVV